jgi:hypothetical protein
MCHIRYLRKIGLNSLVATKEIFNCDNFMTKSWQNDILAR